LPGELIIGADSHTCTYGALGAFATGVGSSDLAAGMITGKGWFQTPRTIKVEMTGSLGPWTSAKDLALELMRHLGPDGADYMSLEFHGPLARELTMEGRMTLANMAVEAGAKAGLFLVDDITREYLDGRAKRPWEALEPDADAEYVRTVKIEANGLPPLVARPHSPHDVVPVAQAGHEAVNQVFIGSCTNGRLEDLRAAARVLQGRQIHPRVRLLVLPATPTIFLDAMAEGLLETFVRAGGQVGPPSCGPCLGGHLGVLAANEVAVATTNRNFIGRMGHPSSRVYLAGPAVAAACAIAGRLAGPEEVCS
jgi:3-isopropylmalate/(R)-2-methylmalate dehydratase large subunit